MDSYYALGATSVPMRKSRLVTAIRFSMCLHYNRFRMRKQATQPKHFHIFSTISKFSQPITTFHNLFFSSILSLHHPTIRTHRSRQGKKEKVLQSCHEKRADLKDSFSVNQIGSMNFQRYFFPLDGGGGVLIQSIFNDPIPFFSTFTKTDFYVIIKRITTYAETEPTP